MNGEKTRIDSLVYWLVDNIGGTLARVTETPNNLGSADGQSGGRDLPLWLLLNTSFLSLVCKVGVKLSRWVGASLLLLLPIVVVVAMAAHGHGSEDTLNKISLVLERHACKGRAI